MLMLVKNFMGIFLNTVLAVNLFLNFKKLF